MSALPDTWSTMTNDEKRAWADAQTAPRREGAAPSAGPKPSASPSAEQAVEDLYARKGEYLKSPRGGEGHTDHK